RAYRCLMVPEISRNRANRFRAGKVADQRHDQILALHFLDETETFFRRQEAPVPPTHVGERHQIRVAWTSWCIGICRGIAQVRADGKENTVNTLNRLLIA